MMTLQEMASSVAPVDLLTCSFLHCPSPSSSLDTLTTARPAHSQYSFGHTATNGALQGSEEAPGHLLPVDKDPADVGAVRGRDQVIVLLLGQEVLLLLRVSQNRSPVKLIN